MATAARQGSSTGQPGSKTRLDQFTAQTEVTSSSLLGKGVVSGGLVTDNGGLSVLVAGASKFLLEGVILTLPASAQLVVADSTYFSRADNAALSVGDNFLDLLFNIRVDTLPTAGNTMGIVGKWASGDLEYLAFLDNTGGTIRFKFQVRNTADTTTTTVTASTFGTPVVNTNYWVHCLHDPTNDRIGIHVNNGTTDYTATTGGVRDGTAAFEVGRHTAANYLAARVDALGVFKGSALLTAGELTTLYNSGVPLQYSALTSAITSKLTAWWDMDERSDGTAAVTRVDAHGASDLTDNGTIASAAAIGSTSTYNGLADASTNTLWATITRTAADQATPSALDTYALTLTSNTTDVAPADEYWRMAYVTTSGGAITAINNAPPGKRVPIMDPLKNHKNTIGAGECSTIESGEHVIMGGPLTINGALGLYGRLTILGS